MDEPATYHKYKQKLHDVLALRTQMRKQGSSSLRRLLLHLRARCLLFQVTRLADRLFGQRQYHFAELFYRLCYNVQALLGHGGAKWIWLRIGRCRKAVGQFVAGGCK